MRIKKLLDLFRRSAETPANSADQAPRNDLEQEQEKSPTTYKRCRLVYNYADLTHIARYKIPEQNFKEARIAIRSMRAIDAKEFIESKEIGAKLSDFTRDDGVVLPALTGIGGIKNGNDDYRSVWEIHHYEDGQLKAPENKPYTIAFFKPGTRKIGTTEGGEITIAYRSELGMVSKNKQLSNQEIDVLNVQESLIPPLAREVNVSTLKSITPDLHEIAQQLAEQPDQVNTQQIRPNEPPQLLH